MRARNAWCLPYLFCILSATSIAHADGKLAQARREVASSESSNSHDDEHEHTHHGHHHHQHSRSFFEALVCAFLSCTEPDYDDDEVVTSSSVESPPDTYAPYPYASPLAPYLLEAELQVASTSSTLDAQLRQEHAIGRPYAAQLALDAGYLEGVAHSGIDARVLTPTPFELNARTTLLYEPAARDYSLFGSAGFGLRFASLRALSLRVLAGVAYFGTTAQMQGGAELGLGFDLFLGRPWVLSARASGVVLGELFCPDARIQLGYLFGRTEIFAAYQYLRIGSVDLSTPLLGTRIWL